MTAPTKPADRKNYTEEFRRAAVDLPAPHFRRHWLRGRAKRSSPSVTRPGRGTSVLPATRPCVPRPRRRSLRGGGEELRGFF